MPISSSLSAIAYQDTFIKLLDALPFTPCRFKEGDKECARYWPDGVSQTFKSENCSVEVRKESEDSSGSVIRRQLRIQPSSEASVGGVF